jgi:phage recombination protein Bet
MPKTKRKPAKAANHSRLRHQTKKSLSSSTAIVPVSPRPIIVQKNRERQLTGEEIELLKRTVCKGASNDEFALFLWTCKKHKLDPITKQIYAVFRNVTKHHQDEKGIWVAGRQMTIQMGIDGLRSLAGRHHRDFGGCDEPAFVMSDMRTPAGRQIPESATVRLWKKGLEHPIVGVAYWDEFAPRDLSESKADFYNRMPRLMLAKCAEAQAIRKGYPDLSDIYTDEEMVQANDDYTPEGRLITNSEGFTPSGQAVTYQAQHGSRAAAQAVAARKIAEANQPPIVAEIVEPEPMKADPSWPVITIDWTNEAHPIVTGDTELFKPLFDAYCKWGSDSLWHTEPRHAESIRSASHAMKFRVEEIMPKSSPVNSSNEKPGVAGAQSKAASRPAQASAPAKVSAHKEGASSEQHNISQAGSGSPTTDSKAASGPIVVKGMIEQFTEKMTKGTRPNPEKGKKGRPSVPYLTVLIKTEKGAQWVSAFDHVLFPFIQKGKLKKQGEFIVQKSGDFWNLLGFKTLESLTFDEDGKTTCIQVDREPGSLFTQGE